MISNIAQIFCGNSMCHNNNYGPPPTFYKNAKVTKLNTTINKQKRKITNKRNKNGQPSLPPPLLGCLAHLAT